MSGVDALDKIAKLGHKLEQAVKTVTGIDERIMIIEADIARAVNAANKISEVDSMISSFTLNLDQFKQEIKNEATERMQGCLVDTVGGSETGRQLNLGALILGSIDADFCK